MRERRRRLRIKHGEAFDAQHLGNASATVRGPRTPHLLVGGAGRADKEGRLATVEHGEKASAVVCANWNVFRVRTIVLGSPNDLAFCRSRLQSM